MITKPWRVQMERGAGTAYESEHATERAAYQQVRALEAFADRPITVWHYDGGAWKLHFQDEETPCAS